MDEAAMPQAASGSTADLIAVSQALEALRLGWGDVYMFSYEDERGYWAAKRQPGSAWLSAGTPEELGRLLADDFGPGPS